MANGVEGNSSDNALMRSVIQGDLDKLGLLFGRYHRALFAYFYRFSFDAGLSEDFVQNVFYRILKYRKNYRLDGRFSTWLFQLARNVRYDHYRKSRGVRFTNDDVQNLEIPADENPVRTLENQERAAVLRKALDALSPEQREVIVLSRYHGLKYREIAAILKCTENTVKARTFRAVEKLRRIYGAREMSDEQKEI
ncbi:MAG: RNA polymerase sigma factor [Candidatus Aminicenantes bacterium]|nr:RNA polymerase sigma factor [Candidatus Aminicenantes bacterium]